MSGARILGVGTAGLLLLAACTQHNPRYRQAGDGGRDLAGRTDAITDALSGVEPGPGPDGSGEEDLGGADTADAGIDQRVADLAADRDPTDVTVDLAPDAVADRAPDGFVPPAGCGTGTANVSSILDADGVVADDDGTLYYLTDDSTNSYVGRILPGGVPDTKWLPVMNSPTTWGLALDREQQRIYVLVVDGGGALVKYDNIKGSPTGTVFYAPITNGNDVVVGSDGSVYFSQQGDRHIYRVPRAGGAAQRVSATTLGSVALKQAPAGLTFDPAGNLLVGLEHGGPIYRLALTGGVETGRTAVGTWTGWANGMTHDRAGRLYISLYDDLDPRSVVRLDTETPTTTTTITSGSRFSSITFGRGTLDCRDLYIADPFGPMRRVRVVDSL
jgi:hypothetical protein